MNALSVINLAQKSGISLATQNGKLIINGTGDKNAQLTPEIKTLLMAWKPKLLEMLKPKMIVLNLNIDGKQVTCLDATSLTPEQAIQIQLERWGSRLLDVALRE